MATLSAYLKAALAEASYEKMEDDSWFASIPGFDGLWAIGETIDDAKRELLDVLAGWIKVHQKAGNRVPAVHGVVLEQTPKKTVEHSR